eukprot:6641453-Prymnesium_polylepis.1
MAIAQEYCLLKVLDGGLPAPLSIGVYWYCFGPLSIGTIDSTFSSILSCHAAAAVQNLAALLRVELGRC